MWILLNEFVQWHNLNDLLEHNVDAKYYVVSEYLETLINYRAARGNCKLL